MLIFALALSINGSKPVIPITTQLLKTNSTKIHRKFKANLNYEWTILNEIRSHNLNHFYFECVLFLAGQVNSFYCFDVNSIILAANVNRQLSKPDSAQIVLSTIPKRASYASIDVQFMD